ncbi:MAG TPA: malto-oligosyltrehalose synthase [Puia sp.]
MQIPTATYRLQLNDRFTLKHVKGIIEYLYQLGISTIYASPITTAFKGSQHGYDVTNPLILSPEIGTEEELKEIAATLRERGMSWLQDIVPNHMAYIDQNPWIADIQEKGRQSPFYEYFDFVEGPGRMKYRRFFTIDSLISLRMENEKVFRDYHERIHHWYLQNWIQGLRIDHVDGLAHPKQYLERLRTLFGEDCYIVVEKILTGEETLPKSWPVQGTTGYDFLAMAGQLFTDSEGSHRLLEFYKQQIIPLPEYPRLVFEKKYDFLHRYMEGELEHLLQLLTGHSLFSCEQDGDRLREALATLMSSFPVYRAYPGDGPLSESDWLIINAAVQKARHFRPDLRDEIGCLESFLRNPSPFRSRLMQFTSPLAAKGIEDTTFYVYNPYIALNEVGDSPGKAGMAADEFHKKMTNRQAHSPHTLNGTTTHDTKRGEDSRIRLSLLSGMPQEWIAAVTRWRKLNDHLPAPSPNDEYLIYQALLGAFPVNGLVTDEFRERMAAYLTKALREAKTETNYESPNEKYERDAQEFVKALLKDDSPFLQDFTPFVRHIIQASAIYSLSLLLLKLTAPGVPDIYQGTELWETSFVDPDNRRPVDYGLRARLLHEIMTEEARGEAAIREYLRAHREEGAEKLFLLYRTLNFRKEYPRLFSEGEYIPVPVKGPLLAFIRRQGRDWALVVLPLIRYGQPLPERQALCLPADAPGNWTHVFTGATHRAVADLAGPLLENVPGGWPVALLSGRS